jgi:DNA invertase Pin-like site-specific DNA recombinase
MKPHTSTARQTIGYARVSTDRQDLSLDAQQAKIRAMAALHDKTLEMIVDAQSAKSLDRPGMVRLLALVDSGAVDTVIIAKLDRLTRSVKDLAELLERFAKHDVSLVSVAESLDTGSASGRLVLNIMVSVAQWEREAIGERTATALQHKRTNRQVFNHTPYGYSRAGDALVASADEQAVIIRIRALRSAGETLDAIAGTLNSDAIPTKRAGGKWYARTVLNVLNSDMREAA